jgi:two-component system chemotaxis response regulator CheB
MENRENGIRNNRGEMIKVLIVDDSPSVQHLLKHILQSDPRIRITGTASNGMEALKLIGEKRPDIITMDMSMPVMDGEETIRKIMETDPIPIVVITSSISAKVITHSYRALTAGALTVIEKPVGVHHPEYQKISAEILRNITSLAFTKLVKRKSLITGEKPPQPAELLLSANLKEPLPPIHHVAIGASTGGPPLIQAILRSLPGDFCTPIYLVQHISDGFLKGFVNWLCSTTMKRIVIAEESMLPGPGVVYIPPNGYEMGLSADGRVHLTKADDKTFPCPSVSFLFESLARNFGKSSMGILLTGMGKDGASGLKMMREAGSITVAQDEESSVIYGMPGEAVKIGAAAHVLSPGEIIDLLKMAICRPVQDCTSETFKNR